MTRSLSGRIVRVAVNALALLVAALLVPDIEVAWGDEPTGAAVTLVALAIVFGLVNAVVRPPGRLVSMPLNVVTLGTFSLTLNASLLLIVAGVLDAVGQPLITIATFPSELTIEAVATSAIGAFIITIVSTTMHVLIPDP